MSNERRVTEIRSITGGAMPRLDAKAGKTSTHGAKPSATKPSAPVPPRKPPQGGGGQGNGK